MISCVLLGIDTGLFLPISCGLIHWCNNKNSLVLVKQKEGILLKWPHKVINNCQWNHNTSYLYYPWGGIATKEQISEVRSVYAISFLLVIAYTIFELWLIFHKCIMVCSAKMHQQLVLERKAWFKYISNHNCSNLFNHTYIFIYIKVIYIICMYYMSGYDTDHFMMSQ